MKQKTIIFNNTSVDSQLLDFNSLIKRAKILQKEIDRQKEKIKRYRDWLAFILGGALSLSVQQEIQKVTVALSVLIVSYSYLLLLKIKLDEFEYSQKEIFEQLICLQQECRKDQEISQLD